MSPEQPISPQEELEAKLTALLLGELPPDEAFALGRKIEQDAGLARTFERLKRAINLIKETEVPVPAQAAQPAPLKLDEKRRKALLQRFKTVKPREFEKPRRLKLRLLEIAAVFALLGMLATFFFPAKSSRSSVQRMASAPAQGFEYKTWSLENGDRRRNPPPIDFGSRAQGQKQSKDDVTLSASTATSNSVAFFSLADGTRGEGGGAGNVPMAWGGPGQITNLNLYSDANRNPRSSTNPFVGRYAFQKADADKLGRSRALANELEEPKGQATSTITVGPSTGLPTTPSFTGLPPKPSSDTVGELGKAGFDLNGGEKDSKNKAEIAFDGASNPNRPPDAIVHKPNPEVEVRIPSILGIQRTNAALVQDAKLLFESGDYDEAEERAKLALQRDPQNTAARYYLDLIQDKRSKEHVTNQDPAWVGVLTKPAAPARPGESSALAFDDFGTSNGQPRSAKIIGLAGASRDETSAILEKISRNIEASKSAKSNNFYDISRAAAGPILSAQTQNLTAPKSPIVVTGIESHPTVSFANRLTAPVPSNDVQRSYQESEKKLKDMEDLNRQEQSGKRNDENLAALRDDLSKLEGKIVDQRKMAEVAKELVATDVPLPKAPVAPPVPQPEVQAAENPFSTFSLNVSDVSFGLAAASLEKGAMPDPAGIRSEEFINAFDYRDPAPPAGAPVAFAWDRARYPFAQNRDLLRFSIKTAAQGREPGKPLNLVLLLDNSGSMERADRVQILRESLRVLSGQLQPQDTLSIVTFARTARLWADAVPGNQAAQAVAAVADLTPEGGTNLEEGMNLAYQTALRHYRTNGINRVVLMTDGAANLGDAEPASLKRKVEENRRQGVALDCFGIGWEGYNDDLLEALSRNGDGRYGFINSPEGAASEFAGQLAGALRVAASDVKVQVEFNPKRVTAYRQVGYAKHQLTKEQFRDNTVDAAEIGAAEAGNAIYAIEVNPAGEGAIATVRVRFRVPGTSDYREQEWTVPYEGNASSLEQASAAMRLAATTSAFSEWLATSPYASEVTPDALLKYINGVPQVYGADARPQKLETMIRQARSLSGK